MSQAQGHTRGAIAVQSFPPHHPCQILHSLSTPLRPAPRTRRDAARDDACRKTYRAPQIFVSFKKGGGGGAETKDSLLSPAEGYIDSNLKPKRCLEKALSWSYPL